MTFHHVKAILKFAETGERPNWNKGKPKNSQKECRTLVSPGSDDIAPDVPQGGSKYRAIAEKVVRPHERGGLSFSKIATTLEVSRSTVVRACDAARPDIVQASFVAGERPNRGRTSILGEKTYRKIRKLLAAGQSDKEIAIAIGCGASTVNRELQRLKQAG